MNIDKIKEIAANGAIGITIGLLLTRCFELERQVNHLEAVQGPERIKYVAAELPEQTVYQITEDDLEEEMYYDSLELLALLVEAEAENQDLTGKRLVVDVVLNRVDAPEWPNTIYEVIMQDKQFSSMWNGRIDRVKEPSEDSFKAVTLELEQRLDEEIVYFTAGGFGKYGEPAYQHMDHYFSRR